jgi:hypothetical protein
MRDNDNRDNYIARAKAWLDNLKTGKASPREVLAGAISSADATPIKNPMYTDASDAYERNADAAKADLDSRYGANRPPMSLYEGMQTVLKLARNKAGFNPLAQPEESGSSAPGDQVHFQNFVDNIQAAGILTLESAGTSDIQQSSTMTDELISSFVSGFEGVQQQPNIADKVTKAVKSLCMVGLSYAREDETSSSFTLAFLQDDPSRVYFSVYFSVFSIRRVENKGMIRYCSTYTLSQALWSLEASVWNDSLILLFVDQPNESTDDWLAEMRTPRDPNSPPSRLCIE